MLCSFIYKLLELKYYISLIRMKYNAEKILPRKVYGSSTGSIPIQVNKIQMEIKFQKIIFLYGENFFTMVFLFFRQRPSKLKMASTIMITPPSFEGIARRIA